MHKRGDATDDLQVPGAPRTDKLNKSMVGKSLAECSIAFLNHAYDLERELSARSETLPRDKLPGAMWLAAWFHDTYESLAPLFGYETNPATRLFDVNSANGKLMKAVCQKLIDELAAPSARAAPTCDWRQDENGVYYTGCGNAWFFETGNALENKAKFCCYCGGGLIAKEYVDEPV